MQKMTITPRKCDYCEGEHEQGSADWRDCQNTQFDELVSNPDDWEFKWSEEHKNRVLAAYLQYELSYKGHCPDVEAIRLMISHQFSVVDEDNGQEQIDNDKMIGFWKDFAGDMPEVLSRYTQTQFGLEVTWHDRKIKAILLSEKKAFLEWETDEVLAYLKGPDTLRAAADKLDALEAAGFSLYHLEADPERGNAKVTWLLRKGRKVDPNEEKSS